MSSGSKATVKDLAKAAGVSLATVDRVLNKRKGVRPKTIEKVEKAVAELNFERDVGASMLARTKAVKITLILPAGTNPFMQRLRQAIDNQLTRQSNARTKMTFVEIPALDATALSEAIDGVEKGSADCLIIVASDDDLVRRAVARANTREIPVLTLVSDLPESRRKAFVGIDNVAAGRTAGALMGRFLRAGEQVGLIVGSLDLRDHRDRFIGFNDVMLEDFPNVQLVGPVEGYDDPRETARRATEICEDNPKMSGIYSMGAGNEGLFEALRARISPHRMRVIVHELNAISSAALQEGYCDVVLDQNPDIEAEEILGLAKKLALDAERAIKNVPIAIGLYMRDNLVL